jgi:hypothetical protein
MVLSAASEAPISGYYYVCYAREVSAARFQRANPIPSRRERTTCIKKARRQTTCLPAGSLDTWDLKLRPALRLIPIALRG